MRTTPTMRTRMRRELLERVSRPREDGFAGVETALRLSPRDPDVSFGRYICVTPTCTSRSGNRRSNGAASQPRWPPGFGILLADLAAANAWAGHDKEAKEAAAQLQKVYPGFTVQTWAGMHWSDDPTFNAQYQRIVEGLRKAGVPEGEKKTD